MNYTEILDFESKKLLQTFALLRSSANTVLLSDLTKKLNVDKKTTMRYLKKLSELIQEYGLESSLEIIQVSKNKIKLASKNDLDVEFFKMQFLGSIPEVVIMQKVLAEHPFQTFDLADQLGMSESSVRKRMQKINHWLNTYQLKLKRASYQLIGPEIQVREFMLQFNWLVNQGINNELLLDHEGIFEELYRQITLFFQLNLNASQKDQLICLLQIAYKRSKANHILEVDNLFNSYLSNSFLFQAFKEMLAPVFHQEEASYLFLIIQAKFLSFFSAEKQAYVLREHYLEKTSCYNKTSIATKALKRTFREFNLVYTKESICYLLSLHLYYQLVSSFSFEKLEQVEELTSVYPNFFKKLNTVIAELQKNYLFFRQINLVTMQLRYFTILSTLTTPIQEETRRLIYLVTDFSFEKEKNLADSLTRYFKDKFNVHVVHGRRASSLNYAEIIVATAINKVLIEQEGCPVLLIDSMTLEELFLKIEKYLKNKY
ncbi:helix-turn-helix domain-containing protein [Enterococcus sp. LJL99]